MASITENIIEPTNKKAKDNSRPKVVWLLFGTQIFLAIGALLGGGAFILAPDGHLLQMPYSHLKNSPFTSFLIPGILLFTFLGVFPLIIAFGLWMRPTWQWTNNLNPFKSMHWSWAGSLITGVIVLIWIMVQVTWVPLGFVHFFYLVYGVTLIALTLLPKVHSYFLKTH